VSGKIRGVAGLITTTTTDRYPRPLVGAYALFILCLIFFSSFIDRQIVGQLAPLIQADLRIRDTAMGLLAHPEWGSKVRDGRLAERREFRTEMRGRLE
jgi:hypothetical protein